QNGRSIITLLIFVILIPYVSSYGLFLCLVICIRRYLSTYSSAFSSRTLRMQRGFHVMQLLQGFLPLAILTVPVLIFLHGAVMHSTLDFATLIFTFLVWICPSVQVAGSKTTK
ncbi:hypothetical protein PMAYCL1PPCAC_15479, partial [Pristionchus mayeri]